jgi:hypothetical protein
VAQPTERSISGVEVRDLRRPEAVVSYPLGENQQVRLAGTVVSRIVLQPGWNWRDHAQPMVGTASCDLYHRGVVLTGRLGIRTDAGEELVIGPDHVFDLRPGHVIWVEGDDELVMLDWAGEVPDSAWRPAPAAYGSSGRCSSPTSSTPRGESSAEAMHPGGAPSKCTMTSSAAS